MKKLLSFVIFGLFFGHVLVFFCQILSNAINFRHILFNICFEICKCHGYQMSGYQISVNQMIISRYGKFELPAK